MRCALCPKRAVHTHHLIAKQVMKREGYANQMNDPRNLYGLCWLHHMDHENWAGHGARRLTRDQLPHEVWAFARELGEWAVVRLERDYPVRERTASTARAHGA